MDVQEIAQQQSALAVELRALHEKSSKIFGEWLQQTSVDRLPELEANDSKIDVLESRYDDITPLLPPCGIAPVDCKVTCLRCARTLGMARGQLIEAFVCRRCNNE